ncbi:MAG TPA: hypothetical protein PKD55_05490 [Bellilinea sp.]|nr:hypothetical protein [Bellilinea sp.]
MVKKQIDDKDLAAEIIKLQTQIGTMTQGVAVENAVGSAPTKAEFDALLESLRDAGVIATS